VGLPPQPQQPQQPQQQQPHHHHHHQLKPAQQQQRQQPQQKQPEPNIRDMIFWLERDQRLKRSSVMYKAFLRFDKTWKGTRSLQG